MSVRIVSEGADVCSLPDANDMRGKLELEMPLNKIWVRGVK